MSKSFGFAQFSSLGEAQRFLEPSFPYITLPPPSHVASATHSPDESRVRRVKIDYSQSANPDAPPRRNGPRLIEGATDGTRDIGSAHVPIILLRNMDISSTLETIAEALRSSEGPGRQSAKGMKRIILVKDRVSKISRGVAFVEFVDVQVRRSPSLDPRMDSASFFSLLPLCWRIPCLRLCSLVVSVFPTDQWPLPSHIPTLSPCLVLVAIMMRTPLMPRLQ